MRNQSAGSHRNVPILPRPDTRIIKPACSQRAVQHALTSLRYFDSMAYESYSAGNPCLDHLLSLSKFNVIRAFVANMEAIGISIQSLEGDTPSPFTLCSPSPSPRNIPVSLCPTVTQCSIPHHPWLDCFPFPKLRDNIINAQSYLDTCEIAVVIMEPASEKLSMLVWGEPWDPWNWEVSEWFVQNWEWIINGCPEILRSSNYWRAKRDLEPLHSILF